MATPPRPESEASTRGTFTFLFTDIEGSTELEARIGRSRYAAIRDRHREILREIWAAHGGREQGTEGDSFFVAFGEAPAAVEAAVAGQRALLAEPWPVDAAISVRMGLNSGGAELSGDSLVGLGINRAARIATLACGGQILASGLTRDLLQDAPAEDVTLLDLGEHRLKGFDSAVRVVQVTAIGLPAEYPPLRSIGARAGNLPSQLTTFVGRDADLAEAGALLARTRVLTLTGPGGTGKTRMSLELAARAADDFDDGAWFVPLEPIRDASLVAPRISAALGLTDTSTRPPIETLGEWLSSRRILIVLDNFEQVVAAAPIVADVLRAASGLKVIITSRAPLHISGEQEFPVPGLPVPPDPHQRSGLERLSLQGTNREIDLNALGQYAAVRLFIDRAVAVRPGFSVTNENAAAVAAISARLQGMPLAIELAAARVKLLTPDAILVRLDHQLDVLAAGARDLPPRQQTLRGAIAWSYDLLDESGRRLLDRLSVFVSGCDLDAVEAVCGPSSEIGGDVLDGLMALVDQSLVKVDETASGEPRFRLLDTIRAYAAERLEADGQTLRIQDRHRDWYVGLADRAAAAMAGSEQRSWLDRLEIEHDDIRAVLDRAVAAPDPPTAIGIAFDMWRFWQKHGHLAEARRRLEAMAEAPWSHDDPRLRARLLEALGGTCWWQGDIAAMGSHYDEALEIWTRIGDEREIANASYNAAFQYSVPSEADAAGSADRDPNREGIRLVEQARDIYRRLGDRHGEANATWGLGNHHYFRGLPGLGIELFREALEIFRSVGDVTMEAWALHMLGSGLLRSGHAEEARRHIGHAVRHFHAAGDASGLTLTLDDLSAVAVSDGDLPRAARLRGAARNLTIETGAQLAAYVEEIFQAAIRPGVGGLMSDDDLARYGAEGAAWTLDEAVAYALEGAGPEPDDGPSGG